MKPNDKHADDPREQRWIAYFLGELGPDERSKVEAEMAAQPGKRAEFEKLFRGIDTWAKEPVPYSPLDVASLDLQRATPAAKPSFLQSFREKFQSAFRSRPTLRFAGALAFAALAIVGLSQADVSIQLGGVHVQWGNPNALGTQVANLDSRLAELSEAVDTHKSQIRDVALQSSLQGAYLEDKIKETAVKLVDLQQEESQTRYRDVQKLMYLSGLSSSQTPDWMREASGGVREN